MVGVSTVQFPRRRTSSDVTAGFLAVTSLIGGDKCDIPESFKPMESSAAAPFCPTRLSADFTL